MRTLFAALMIFAVCASAAFGQSSINNPIYKPYARFVIPVQLQPEFTAAATNISTNTVQAYSGSVTNVSTNTVQALSGWVTNVVSFTTVSNGLVSVTNMTPTFAPVATITTNVSPTFAAMDLVTTNVTSGINTNTFPYCDFELFAIDQSAPGTPVFYASSISTAEWDNYPSLQGKNWSSTVLQ